MRRLLLGCAVILGAACRFDGLPAADDTPMVDARPDEPDALPGTCGSVGETGCDGRTRKVCGANHQWDDVQDEECNFTCVAGQCADASNLAAADVGACEGAALARLSPVSGSVTITEPVPSDIRIVCSTGCGDAPEIQATRIAGSPGIAWFCLSEVVLPAGVFVGVPSPSGGPDEAIVLVVDGPVAISSGIGFDGFPATAGTAGEGAPGGFDGGAFSIVDGDPGGGTCGGGGGLRGINGTNIGAGGGGGGGHAAVAGSGGNGRSPNGNTVGTGGGGGGTCGEADLEPLLGGSGGGGGADGNCGGDCGWPGGGGGGAIQISSRTSISITGMIGARGGDGWGVAAAGVGAGGSGGGGAGGEVLLEAPTVTVVGTINVDGGNGGDSLAGSGGDGATAGLAPTDGASESGNGQGGAGGGGAGGRVRIRAANPLCAGVTPISACTTALLP